MTNSELPLDLAGWFPNTNQKVLQQLINEYDIKSVIEVGSFLGRSTIWFARRVAKVTAIDIFEPSSEAYLNTPTFKPKTENMLEQFERNLEFFNIKNVKTLKMDSETAAKKRLSADLVYIDASHEYENVLKDIKLWLPKAKKVLAGDDNTQNWVGVQQAIRDSGLDINTDNRCWFHLK